MSDEGTSLDPCIGQLAFLLAVEHIPSPSAEGLVKLFDELGVDEVDKSIADVALVVLINRKIEEVGPVLE